MNRVSFLCGLLVAGLCLAFGCATPQPSPARAANAAPTATPSAEKSAWEELKQTFEKAVDVGAQEGDAALAKLKENFQSAQRRADDFARQFPNSGAMLEVKYMKANAHWQLAQLESKPDEHLRAAATLANEILTAKPSESVGAKASWLLIAITAQRGDGDDAMRAAEQFVKKYPRHEKAPAAEWFMAQTAYSLGQAERARAAASAVMKNYPQSREAKAAAGLLRRVDIVGKPLADLQFTALDGRRVDIKDYRGKVVLVDFWATWCGPCRAEMPNVIKTYRDFHGQGFEVIGISLDEERKPLEKYVAENQMVWPEHFDGKGWENIFAQRFGVTAIPSNLLLDPRGMVVRTDVRGDDLSAAVKLLVSQIK